MEVRFTSAHDWVRNEGGGIVTVGVTDYAQGHLGDVVYVELPKEGTHHREGGEVGVVESVKAASDIVAPLAGTIISVNSCVKDDPSKVNSAPEGEGWLYKMKLDSPSDFNGLLNASAYAAYVAGL